MTYLTEVGRLAARLTGRFVLYVAVMAVTYVLALHFLPVTGTLLTEPAPHVATLADHVHHVLTVHGCWQGAAPHDMAGKMPGHAVVGLHGQVRYGAQFVGPALDHVFKGTHPHLTVYGFCR